MMRGVACGCAGTGGGGLRRGGGWGGGGQRGGDDAGGGGVVWGVRLVGGGRSGRGIGAVVGLGRDGEWGAAREVHGGSGYWSQDSAVQVMSLKGVAATQIQVRWPGGKVTTNNVPVAAKEIEVNI